MRLLLLARHAGPDPGAPARALNAARGLASHGHEVRLLACARAGEPLDETIEGVRVERVPDPPPMIPDWDQVSRSLQDGMVLFERGISSLLAQPADLLVGMGWPVATAAVGLRRSFETPLVALLEPRRIARRRRRWGRGDVLIEETERWLASGSARVVVRSSAARAVVIEQLAIPAERVRVIAGSKGAGARLAGVCSEALNAPITIGDARRALAR
ncbi:MAG TPA: glycosyltransferase family 4 protein [Actinomycetota bacterium]